MKNIFPVIIILLILLSFPVSAQKITFEKRRKHKLVDTITELVKPDSIHIKGRNYEFFDSTAITGRFALGGNFFLGSAILNGNISNYFTNPYFAGFQINLHFNRVIFQIDDYLGLCKVKQTMEFPDQLQWEKGKSAGAIALGLNLGYSIIERRKINVSLFTGIGKHFLGNLESSENSKNEAFSTYYKVGCHIDFKNVTIDDHVRINNRDVAYSCLRLNFGCNVVTRTAMYPQYYTGPVFYIGLGIGMIQRGYCSEEQCRF